MEIREELWLRSWVGLSCDGKSQVKMVAVELSREGAYAPQAWERWERTILELEAPQLFVFASGISLGSYSEDVEGGNYRKCHRGRSEDSWSREKKLENFLSQGIIQIKVSK